MKISFIHLSDLHYIPEKWEDYSLVCSRLCEDIKSQNLVNPHLIFSGDFSYQGSEKTYYESLLKELDKNFSEAGILPSNRFTTPGNHDVSQDITRDVLLIQKGCLGEINEERVFNDNLPTLTKQLLLPDKFSNYLQFTEAFSTHRLTKDTIAGEGWQVSPSVSVYSLNTALCSFGGIKDTSGNSISDEGRLMVDTRRLHRWLITDKSEIRILIMHHPLEWLAEWAQKELKKIINESFKLVYRGHIHEVDTEQRLVPNGGALFITAPALFTKKSEQLGYSITTIDTDSGEANITFRQFASNNRFVLGTLLAGNDAGIVGFNLKQRSTIGLISGEVETATHKPNKSSTLCILKQEFDEAIRCYSNREGYWIERELSKVPESDAKRGSTPEITSIILAQTPRSCIIRAPKEFGISSLGCYIALKYHELNGNTKSLVKIDFDDFKNNPKDVARAIETRCNNLSVTLENVAGIILDNWTADKSGKKLLTLVKQTLPNAIYIILSGVDDYARVGDFIEKQENDPTEGMEILYLWSLNRSTIRALVEQYTADNQSLDCDSVTRKLILDIDTLNTHRSPINCLMLLRLIEQAFDDSPVNRTEMIRRVLNILFFQFNEIPSYATRPDLKDCEFVLGYFSEKLIRESRKTFSKREFFQCLDQFCESNDIDLDIDVLFAFLNSENIFLSKSGGFEFRFNYWLYYFAAHRMHHAPAFAQFILSEGRYAGFPEVLEFYAGITRKCQDAVDILIVDLKKMNEEFIQRTGIPESFNPLSTITWHPTEKSLEALKKEVSEDESMAAVPAVIKDAIADSGYDRHKPYNQELAKFISESSLQKMMLAVKGAARALRNSDYVEPKSKAALLDQVMTCWCKVAQILAMLSPALANSKHAHYENINFMLDHSFDHLDTVEKRWQAIMNSVASNVVNWYQEDISSRKMGPLLIKFTKQNTGKLGELLAVYVLIKQKPTGWEDQIHSFIINEHKNSFYLNRAFELLMSECKYGENSERNRQYLRKLAAMALAKHDTGAKNPKESLVEEVAKQIVDGKSPSFHPSNYHKKTFG